MEEEECPKVIFEWDGGGVTKGQKLSDMIFVHYLQAGVPQKQNKKANYYNLFGNVSNIKTSIYVLKLLKANSSI